MLTDQLKELTAAKAKVAALEGRIASERNAELKALPAKLGFDGIDSLIAALRAAGGGRGRKTGGAAKGKGRRTRAVITDATRKKVKELVEAGMTGGEIAKAVGISLPSVQNIKKVLGLVKAKKK